MFWQKLSAQNFNLVLWNRPSGKMTLVIYGRRLAKTPFLASTLKTDMVQDRFQVLNSLVDFYKNKCNFLCVLYFGRKSSVLLPHSRVLFSLYLKDKNYISHDFDDLQSEAKQYASRLVLGLRLLLFFFQNYYCCYLPTVGTL